MVYAQRALLALTLAVCGVVALPGASGSAATPGPEGTGQRVLYLVQVDGAPLASYEGGITGLPATRPREGDKLDKKAWSYQAYRQHLRTKRAQVLRDAGLGSRQTVAEYNTAFNGFAVELNSAEKGALERTNDVVRVWKNEIRTVDTSTTPTFLGLTGPSGAWNRQFGDPNRAGEGVVVGVIDTGYWPESPSLAPLPEPRPDANVIHEKWYADGIDKCDEGTGAAGRTVECNNKVIGARWYNASGLGGWAEEFASPRDYDGHGTHTATTAAGLYNVATSINGENVGPVSGMAPAARVAVYKALWRQANGEASGGTVDLVRAIDDAVTDGVDVINYSVSGSSSYIIDPTELAFFNAAAAGVFVATSAGNSGPGASTVAHNAPWTTTVAASSHDRGAAKSVTLGDGQTYLGAGQGPAVPSAPLVDAVAAGKAGADAVQVELCYPEVLNPAVVTGKIVLCKRGVNSRTDKSLAVRDAGGVGMVLYNPTVNSLNADFHFVPTVHIGPTEGAAVKAYLSAATSPTAALSEVNRTPPRAPEMAAFSSTGPALAGGGSLLKPDITAPGVDIIAGVSPAGHHGNLFDGLSGTSMSGPHIAGIGALLRSRYPSWSPTAVRSALMTTAGTRDSGDGPILRAGTAATPLDYGAGHARPARAFDPGLVYESTPQDWIRYGCGIGQFQLISDWCPQVGSMDASELNYPSIAIGNLPGEQRVTRTVTNVTDRAGVYVAAIEAPRGFTVKVVPQTIVVPARGSATFEVRIGRTNAAYSTWSFGAITWTDLRGHAVRSPLAVRPVALFGPAEISGTGVSGSATVEVRGGYRGTVTASAYGLVPSTVSTATLVGGDVGFSSGNPAASATVLKYTVTVPTGTKAARVATFNSDHAAGSDIDLYAYRTGALVGQSAGGTADEEITLTTPGSYDVYAVQFSLPVGVTQQEVKAHAFVVGGTSTGNLDVRPASQRVAANQTIAFTLTWHNLEAARRYLGILEFGDGTAPRAQTLITVTP